MTKFKFEDLEEFNVDKNNIDNIQTTNDNIGNILKSYLNFIYKKSTIPQLPSTINIVYVKENNFFKGMLKKLNYKKYQSPPRYVYPASIIPENSTLYLSTDFNKSNKTISKIKNGVETNDIVLFRNYFNQDNQKAIEYTFGHELGHFFLLSENHKKPKLEGSNVVMRIASNIEEGFAESFSIQLMYLKDSNFNINSIKNGRFNDFKKRIKSIESEDYTKEEWLRTFRETGFENILDKYDFRELFNDLPIRDNKGEIEQDINVIYDKCLDISMENNKQAILSIMNNPYFKKFGLSDNFENLMNDSLKKEDDKKNLLTMINSFHSLIKGKSFNTTSIKMLREKFLHTQNDSTYKPT